MREGEREIPGEQTMHGNEESSSENDGKAEKKKKSTKNNNSCNAHASVQSWTIQKQLLISRERALFPCHS